MLKRLYALIIKEFLAVLKDRKSRFVLIGVPLIQLFVLAFAATLDVTNASIAILNKDEGKLSYELIQRFCGCKTFRHIRYLTHVQELKEVIENQEAMMAIHIDEQFSRDILQGKPAKVQLILDGRKSNTTQIVQGYAMQIIQQYNNDLLKNSLHPQPTSEIIARNWFNPNLIYTWFTVPALIGILTTLVSLLLTSLSIAREREIGTFDQLLVSPLTTLDILIGKSVPAIVLSFLEGCFILAATILFFKVPFTGSFLALFLSMFVFISAIVGIGLFLSSLCQTQQQALLSSFVFMAPAVILSGYATPIENMPNWMQNITLINPLRYYLVIIRTSFLKNPPFSFILENLIPIALIAIFNLVFSAWFFRKRLD
jgi:ABC-2 type transport system permease protein